MNWRPRSATVSGASRGASATEVEYMELINDAGTVVASFAEDVDGDFSHNLPLANGVKVYRALLTQSSTDAPAATVLENTLGGTVVWTYDAAGEYDATLTGAFTDGKTFLLTQPTADADGILNGLAVAKRLNANTVRMYVAALNDLTSPSDALLLDTPIQITVFP